MFALKSKVRLNNTLLGSSLGHGYLDFFLILLVNCTPVFPKLSFKFILFFLHLGQCVQPARSLQVDKYDIYLIDYLNKLGIVS